MPGAAPGRGTNIMKKSRKITNQINEEIEDILCNLCGESLKTNFDFEGLIEHKFLGGYGSKLGDGIQYTFSLCESCLSKLFKQFGIPVEKNYFFAGSAHSTVQPFASYNPNEGSHKKICECLFYCYCEK